ncbi:MAG: L-2-hydroxyglutarate oxidase [SAR202 cluster bacterium]|nr:L-2-hydroxyglutarate oxidase [SAR202 cluster bacterium]
MTSRSYDIAVVGGGIVGLATAMRLAQEYPKAKVAVLEKEKDIALHQTGHNSGVIHAGIYYAPGSQKANFCSIGGKMLREFSDKHGIKYEMCGKLIVATDESEAPKLDDLFKRGTANGAIGLEMVGQERVKEIEPHVIGVKGIFSPGTGIIDYKEVSRKYLELFRQHGGELFTESGVKGIKGKDGKHYLETPESEIAATYVINCAGLHCVDVAKMLGLETGLRIIPFRGEYFSLTPQSTHLVKGLIYPVPNPKLPFLGVHFTKRIDGSVEAGPNAVLAFAREGYNKWKVEPGEVFGIVKYGGFWKMAKVHWKSGMEEQYRSKVKGSFVRSLQKLVPEITGKDLWQPSAGVRAQAVSAKGELLQDFRIVGTPKSIHVLNAPSPAATSSLAISRYIVDQAKDAFGLAELAAAKPG